MVIAAFGCQSVATTSAKLRNQEGNYELAIKLAEEAIAKNPKDAEAHFQLGVSYSYLDSVALSDVRAFESELYKFIDARHSQIFKDIVAKKQLDDQTKAALDGAVKEFAAQFAARTTAAA